MNIKKNISTLWQKIWKLQNVPIDLKRNNAKGRSIGFASYLHGQGIKFDMDIGNAYSLMKTIVNIFFYPTDKRACIAMLHLGQILWGVWYLVFSTLNVSICLCIYGKNLVRGYNAKVIVIISMHVLVRDQFIFRKYPTTWTVCRNRWYFVPVTLYVERNFKKFIPKFLRRTVKVHVPSYGFF